MAAGGMVTLKINATEANRKLKALPEIQRRRLRVVIIRDVRQLSELVRANLSGRVLNIQSGKLIASIRNQLVENAKAIYGQVFSIGVPYARIHEFGGQTRPHKITARNAQALHFFIGQQEFFRKSVNHPGSKIPERSYMRAALAELRAKIVEDMTAAVKPNWRDI